MPLSETLQPWNDPSLSFTERRRLFNETRGKTLTIVPETISSPDGAIVGLEDLERRHSPHSGLQAIDAACDSIGIIEVYTKLSKNKFGDTSGRARTGEGIMISCPNPSHADSNPSAWITTDKGPGGLYTCGGCGFDGGDKFTVAAFAYGLDVKADFPEIKARLARELRGVELEKPAPAPALIRAEQVARPLPTDDPWEAAVIDQKNKRMIQLEGDYRARQERSAGLFTPPLFIADLETELAEPDPATEWTVENTHSVGGNTTITAGFKVGKTTFVMNLVKALADQESFLGEHEVRKLSGRIAYWNNEVEETQMRRTFREMGIRKPASIWHLPLRGHPMNLMDDAAYRWAVSEMRRQEIEVWILDPFSGAYYGDENDNSQINAFTKRLDEFKLEAGIKDLFMPVHTGRYVEEGNERARGGAKLDDWADNRWVLAKHAGTGDRYFKAEGRRVAQEERELHFRRADNSLVYSAFSGTRKQKAGNVIRGEVLAFIASHPGCSGREICAGIGGRSEAIRAVIQKLIASFDVETRAGGKNAILHYRQGAAPTALLTPPPSARA